MRAVERTLASSLARAAAAEGRLADDGWLLAIPAGLLVLLWFRRGTTLRWGALLLALLPPPEARANPFWTPDQQGRRLYEAHEYPEAAAAFSDPEWRAAALFRAGKYAEAAEILAGVRTSTAQYNRGTALVRGRDYQGAVAAFEAALALDPGNAAAQTNLDLTKRIIDYLTEARQQSDDEQTDTADATVEDLTGEEGKRVRVDASSQLSEDAAAEWMRSVETKPADFLKSRFAIEAARP